MKKPIYKDLFFQVVVGIVLGIALGAYDPKLGAAMEPLGKGFINLIKMMIAPIIFCTIVTGVAGMDNMKKVGKVGGKAILLFEVITTLALIIGLVLVEIWQPGAGLDLSKANIDVSKVQAKLEHTKPASSTEFLLHIIPTTMVSAFSEGDLLQVLLVALLFAAALPSLGAEKSKQMLHFIEMFSGVLFRMMDIITKAAPIGAFGAMAYTVGQFGFGSLKELGSLLVLFFVTCALFIFLVLGPIMRFYCGLSTMKFLAYLKDELLIVLGTSSSESVLPQLMEKLERMGCAKSIVGMVVPAGYSFNLVGSSIYFTMGALFIVYATHSHITMETELWLLAILLIASKGAAGVSGSAFIVMAATLKQVNIIPDDQLTIGLAFIFGVDRFMSTGRAITNLIGNGITTLVVAKWENELDIAKARRVLDQGSGNSAVPKSVVPVPVQVESAGAINPPKRTGT